MNVDKLTEINLAAVGLVKGIKILSAISWPVGVEHEFIAAWEAGNRKQLPTITYPAFNYRDTISNLTALANSFTPEHPLEVFTHNTIKSYIAAAEMVQSAGSPRFQEMSIQIFGQPGDIMPGSSLTHVAVAQKILKIANSFAHPYIKEPDLCIRAETIADFLRERIKEHFGARGPEVKITDKIAAKATAGALSVKLRPGTCFTRYDSEQLLVHEVMTHSLTSHNGLNQKILKILAFGAPRTTGTQEGLATFSEVITGAIDLRRLARLALRVIAIDNALKGANFMETLQMFLENGHTLRESFLSAARIFRGGYPDQAIVFTKDAVYIDGLIKVHTLFRWALTKERLNIIHLLFCGRLTIEDLFLLEDAYGDGYIDHPQFLPPWYERIEGLAGILSFSQVTSAINEGDVERYFDRGCVSV